MIHIPHREDNIFSIVFFIILIVPLLFIPIYPESYETVKYPLFLMLTGAGTIILLLRKQIYLHKTILWLLGGFILLNIVSSIFSLDAINSVIGLYGRYTGSLMFISSWGLFIILVWNAINQDEKRRLTLLRLLTFDGLAVAVLGILQYFNFAYYSGNSDYTRTIIPSFIGNQNFFAMFLLAILPAVIVLWQHAQSKVAKYYLVLTGVVIIWAMILSGSRGGILGLAAMAITFLFISVIRKYPKQYIVGILGALLLATGFYFGFFANVRSDTIQGSGLASDYTIQSRYVIWSNTLKLIADRPWLGTGPGNFFIAFEKLNNTALSGNERFDDAHNLVLHIASTAGLPALILFLCLIGVVIFAAWRESEFQKPTAVWALSAIIGIIVAASFNPVSVTIWLLLAVVIGFATSYNSVQRELKLQYKIPLLAVALIITLFGAAFIASETFGSYGQKSYARHNNEQAENLLRKAVLFNPYNSAAKIYLIAAEINLHHNQADTPKQIDAILAQHSRSAGTYISAADLYYRLYITTNNDDYKNKMNQLFEASVQLEPGTSSLYGSGAYAFYKTGQIDKAVDFLNRQLSFAENADYPYSWVLLSKIYFEQGDRQKSLSAMEKASDKLTDQPLIKHFLVEMRSDEDMSKILFPVSFPDLDI